MATKFKIGMPATEVAAEAADAAIGAAAENGETAPSQEEVGIVVPELTPAQVEQQQRQLDLDRLNTMSIEDRRAIASMDMMGDYGSKVRKPDSWFVHQKRLLTDSQINFLVKHLLWYQSQDSSTRHVVFSNWSDSLRSGWSHTG